MMYSHSHNIAIGIIAQLPKSQSVHCSLAKIADLFIAPLETDSEFAHNAVQLYMVKWT